MSSSYASKPGSPQRMTFATVDDVAGRRRPATSPPGRRSTRNHVRSPLLVKRGDVVDVFARAGGVQVRTKARARDEGGHGDLVNIELLNDRRALIGASVRHPRSRNHRQQRRRSSNKILPRNTAKHVETFHLHPRRGAFDAHCSRSSHSQPHGCFGPTLEPLPAQQQGADPAVNQLADLSRGAAAARNQAQRPDHVVSSRRRN